MDWQQLRSFYTIVKLGSMTRAADAMFRNDVKIRFVSDMTKTVWN